MEGENTSNRSSPPQLDIENEGSLYVNGIDDGIPSSAGSLHQPLLHKSRTNTTSQIAIVGANVSAIESLDYEYVPPFYFLHTLLMLLTTNWASIFFFFFC